MGALVEHSLCMFLEGSKFETCTAEDLRKADRRRRGRPDGPMLGPGPDRQYRPVEGIRRGIRLCMDLGYADPDIRKMVSINTAQVLRLESLVEPGAD